jgi:maltose-binding protein MalE
MMLSNHNYMRRWWFGMLPLAIGFIFISCQGSATESSQTLPTREATVTAFPQVLPTVAITPTLAITTTSAENVVELTFWTVEPVSPRAADEAGNFFSQSVQTFERDNPGLKLNLLLKKASGKGGVLDFLRTAKEVAPTILPDVAVMNATDLPQAYAEGLLQPLENRLDRTIVQDLLPAARRMGTFNERLIGVPIGLEMEHTVYNTKILTATPILWSDVLSSQTKYLFPAKGVNGLVNDITLSQYFSAGGTFRTDEGKLNLNDQVLREVLNFYYLGLKQNVLEPDILQAASPEELWPIYLKSGAGLAQISVRQYLADRATMKNTAFAPLPVQQKDDTPVSITHGWVLVLITEDVNRQRAALRLIEWFLSTSNNATWNNLNRSIPTRDTAYKQLAGDDPYWVFLTEQLNNAQPQPGFAGYDQVGRIIQQAVEQVIRGETTPEQATATAVDALTP